MQALIAEDFVTRNGKAFKDASAKVKANEVYIVHLPPPEPAEPAAQKIPLKILYEDDDLLVIDKPVGMVVHPAPGNRDQTLVNALLAHCGKSLSGVGGVARPGIVHRLDKDTSGLLVVAKNDLAHQVLQKQFGDRSLSRTYYALVWGIPPLLADEIDAPIGRHARDRKKMAVTGKGKASLTRYRVLKVFDSGAVQACLVECKLATGRTHQIRVHMAHIKHPVIGDPVYGRKNISTKDMIAAVLYDFPRQALHARELQFLHPRTHKRMRFNSDIPPDMAKLLRQLKKFEQ
jgi:23S rRNA pseudouridine1911/1915/1917 synthase